jgi:hypothetical protein
VTYEAQRIAVLFDAYAASAAGLFAAEPPEPELRDLMARVEIELGAEAGAISSGEHILAALRKQR